MLDRHPEKHLSPLCSARPPSSLYLSVSFLQFPFSSCWSRLCTSAAFASSLIHSSSTALWPQTELSAIMQLIYSLLPALAAAAAIDRRDTGQAAAKQEGKRQLSWEPPALRPASDPCPDGLSNVGGVCVPAGSAPAVWALPKRNYDICGLDMVWDGTRCRVPVGKRGQVAATQEEKRVIIDPSCPSGLIRDYLGDCVYVGVATRDAAPEDDAASVEKRASTWEPPAPHPVGEPCPEGSVNVGGACVPPLSAPAVWSLPKRDAYEICGLAMVWDGTRCRVPVGKRDQVAATQEEKRQFGCPAGHIPVNGACYSPGAAPGALTAEKRQLGCPPGLINVNGACLSPGAASAVLPAEKRSACGSNAAFVEGQGCVARSTKQNKRRSQ